MRRAPFLAVLVTLVLAPLAAAEQYIPPVWAEPLGVLIDNSTTILVLKVKAIGDEGVVFEIKEALKGQTANPPFKALSLLEKKASDDPFHVGDLSLYFFLDKGGNDQSETLFISGRWFMAWDDLFLDVRKWVCYAEPWESEPRFVITYDGSFEDLQKHVKAILAGREVTITARAPKAWDARGGARLWRIKAGLKITTFCLSDESPLFVGWGSGDPKEVAKLVQVLGAGTPHDRASAADDLANMGAAGRPALPDLRRTVQDAEPSVAVAATKAVARLDADDKDTIDALTKRLHHDEEGQRILAADALRDLGPRGRTALPALLRAFRDDSAAVRARAAVAVGEVAPDSPSAREAVTSLADLLHGENEGFVRSAAIRALGRFGPAAAAALLAVRQSLSAPDDPHHWPDPPKVEAFDLVARFNPPPAEWLADAVTDPRLSRRVQLEGVRVLGALGPRARVAFPALRQAWDEELRNGKENHDPDPGVAEALLDVDPLGAPAMVAPGLIKVAQSKSFYSSSAIMVLGRCGAARPDVPALLRGLDRKEPLHPWSAHSLIALLGPEQREQLPALRELLDGPENASYLAEALWRMGYREEALAAFTRCLENKFYDQRIAAARWLGQHPREAHEVAATLRKARDKAIDAERARLDLTLWRADGAKGAERRVRALTALDDLLAVSDDAPPLHFGTLYQCFFWAEGAPWTGLQEDAAIGNAVTHVHARLDASDNTLDVLTDLLKDRSSYVRLAAAVALARAEPRHPDAVPALQQLLGKHPHLLCYSADTLTALGPAARAAGPTLAATVATPQKFRVSPRRSGTAPDRPRACGERLGCRCAWEPWPALGRPGSC